jgi:hypothetical protein
MIHATVIKPDFTELYELADFLLEPTGDQKLISYSELVRFAPQTIMAFCKFFGFHTIATKELTDWIAEEIGDKHAIEICAGRGIIGKELGIPQTDSRLIEKNSELRDLYALCEECIDPFPERILTYDAISAVEHFKSHTVIGSWVTELSPYPRDYPSSPYGVDEHRLLKNCKKYIMLGNENTHKKKTIRRFPHRIARPYGYVTRSVVPEKNIIYIWEQA